MQMVRLTVTKVVFECGLSPTIEPAWQAINSNKGCF